VIEFNVDSLMGSSHGHIYIGQREHHHVDRHREERSLMIDCFRIFA
jgi:hypothetical protein